MKKPVITINLLGDIAAGKGTQAKLLAKKYNLKHIDTGVYSRSLVKKGVKGAKGLVDRGKLTKSNLIKSFLKKELSKLKSDQGLILDGAKMPSEAMMVNKILKQKNRKPLVLYLSIPKKESLNRLKKRQRLDDDPKAIKNRIEYYEEIYSKTIMYWHAQGSFKKVNGLGSIMSITKRLTDIIENHYGIDQI